MTNFSDMLSKAKEMQEKMKALQEEIADREVTGFSGGEMVKVLMNGKGEVNKVTISPEAINISEKDLLEDLIAAACNDARKKVDNMNAEEMQKLTGGMSLPGGLNLPF